MRLSHCLTTTINPKSNPDGIGMGNDELV
uniref:Uncharacterized protein n=1 Tax=Rhizophora mucronata TaxID=61149 RepID=A0A2P2PTI3_RHIMU